MDTAKGRVNNDATTDAILYEGASIEQLSRLFKMDKRTVKAKVYGMKPVARRNGTDIYSVHEVAGKVWRPTEEEVDAAMLRLNPQDLPKMITKEYWAGRRARQAFEREEGDLWSTTEVVEKVGDLMKIIKLQTTLMCDGVERNTELSERQRKVITQLTRGMLADLEKAIVSNFTKRPKKVVNVQEADDDEL
jgi:hypothetical protein